MKRKIILLINLTVLIVVSTILFSCKDNPKIIYYTVSIVPPKAPLTTPSINVSEGEFYDSDEAAIKKETNLLHRLQDKYYEEAIKENHENQSLYIDLFKNVRDGQHFLLKITHKDSEKLDDFINIIKEHGLLTTELTEYCQLNGMDYATFPIEQKKYNDFLQIADESNPLVGTYFCERSRDYYIIKPDNTGIFISSGQKVSIKWKQEGKFVTIFFNYTNPVKLKFDERTETLEESSKEAKEMFGTTLIYKKQG